ncbi:hypothetical protein ACJQWK_04195 [Exserohilum turcicum]
MEGIGNAVVGGDNNDNMEMSEAVEDNGPPAEACDTDHEHLTTKQSLTGSENMAALAPTSPESASSLIAMHGSSPRHSPTSSLSALPTLQIDIAPDDNRETHTIIPIQNPEAFPLSRIQEIQASFYPSAAILSMWTHVNTANQIIRVTADLANGPVDHLLIQIPHIISSLGLREPAFDTITLQPSPRVDETYKIRILPHQNPKDPNAWVVGELVSARHAYLYWLDERQCSDPKGRPSAAEARAIAVRTRRRAWDVMGEIERYWEMESGSGGKKVREMRGLLLGEDPVYPSSGEGGQRGVRSLWV